MGNHTEYFDGGLVTTRDPLTLEESQLIDMRNCVYRAGSRALHRAKGRAAFGTVSATAVDVNGLRDVRFDNGDHYLIALASSIFYSAPVGDTGSFGSFDSSLTAVPDRLDIIHFRNRFYMLTGVAANASGLSSNRVLYQSATAVGNAALTRQHGMIPVVDSPSATTTTTGTFSTTVTGYYEYWTTEVARFRENDVEVDLESSFTGNPTTVFVNSTAMTPTIQMPPIRNLGFTTHWRIYRSTKKDAESDKRFPIGFLISQDISTATAQQADTITVTATNFAFPTTYNTSGAYSSWTLASALGVDDGTEASVVIPALSVTSHAYGQGAYGFNFGGFNGAVKGIEIVVEARVSTGSLPAELSVKVGNRDPVLGGFRRAPFGLLEIYGSKSFLITGSAAGSTYTLGSSADLWLTRNSNGGLLKRVWADTDFGATFMVVIESGTPSRTLAVDYVKVKAYYSATSDGIVPFPTVVYTFGDISVQEGKNREPPAASTGDIYEDSLVLNDLSNPALIRYSAPSDPDIFPATYFIDFETDENDQVRLIKVVNNRLIVGLDGSVWRVNYLPSERDASFDRGKAKEPITRSYGIVNSMCAALYSPTGDREFLAYVSHQGIHTTDGFGFDTLTDDVEWRNIISTTSTSTPIALVNDQEEQELIFYYRNDSLANETFMALHISYAESDRPRVSGPVHMRNFDSAAGGTFASLKSAWTVRRSTGAINTYLGYGGSSTAAGAGKVYRETGSNIPVQDATMQWTTRDMPLAGIGNEWVADQFTFFVSEGTPVLTVTPKTMKTNDASGLVTQGSISRTLTGERFVKLQTRQIGETQRYAVVASGQQDIAIQFMHIGGTDFGEGDSGE